MTAVVTARPAPARNFDVRVPVIKKGAQARRDAALR